jgi:energy-coupling factor transporter ATP-binding protein EcfA2
MSYELTTKVMQLIQDGNKAIDDQDVRSDIVMFIGMTGSGKSALINYINGVQLQSFSENGGSSYRLKVKDLAAELPGIKIGHSAVTSCTRHPGIYSPPGKSFSHVDTGGFDDTGDPSVNNNSIKDDTTNIAKIAQDIANAYFRKAISEKATKFKIVLVVTHHDLDDRAGKLPRSLQDFAYFMQGIENDKPEILDRIKNSIAIVVTKIKDPQQNIRDLEQEISDLKPGTETWKRKSEELVLLRSKNITSEQVAEISLKNFIGESPAVSKKMAEVLNYIVTQKHFATFSTPFRDCDKSFDEAYVIQEMIERKINFVSKEEANIGIKVSNENVHEVVKAIKGLKIIGKRFIQAIDKDITEELRAAFESMPLKIAKIQKIKTNLEILKTFINPCTLEAFFDNTQKQLKLSEKTIREFNEFKRLLNFFVNLLPEKEQKKYVTTKWMAKLELASKIDKHIEVAKDILNEPQVQSPQGHLTIQGYDLKTSQVATIIAKHVDIKSITIQALHTLTFDNDLTKCRGVNLSIIAPNVVISGDRVINLSGTDGTPLAKASKGADGGHGAKVGEATAGHNGANGSPGLDGLPGDAGMSAGNLFIVCDTFKNKEHLKVYLNGGKGAKGQDGGDGGNGGNGSDVTWKEGLFKYVLRDGWMPASEVARFNGGYTDQLFRLVGGDGGVGGNGGRGGKCGDSGKNGIYHLIVAGKVDDTKPYLEADARFPGKGGNPGEPGNGGACGRHAEGKWHTGGNPSNDWHGVDGPHYVARVNAGRGSKLNELNDRNWQASSPITEQKLNLLLLDYRIYLEKELLKNANVIGNLLSIFKESCEGINVIDLKTRTMHLLEEANILEEYYSKYGKNIDFTAFYYSLLARVKVLALNPARTPQGIKVLEYLYVATLGSLARLNTATDNLLVVDILGYVKNLVNGDFATLQRFQAAELKRHYKEQYADNIEKKMTEAKSFLDILKRDISSKQLEIEPKIAKLVSDVKAAQQAGGAQSISLQNKRRELEEALHKKAILGVINIVVQGIGMIFPPAGPIVAGVVNAGLNMAMNPSFESAMNFASSVVEMKSQLGNLPPADKTKKHEADLFKKVQAMAKTLAPLVKDVKDLLAQKNEGDAQLAQLDNEIQKVNAYIIELDVYLKTVPKALGDYLEGMVQEVTSFQEALNDKSLVSLDFSKLEIKRFFAGIKQNIKAIVGNFGANEGFEDFVLQMAEAIDVSVNICTRVQDYRDHMAFANFIAHLHTAGVQTVSVDNEYQAFVDTLELRLKQSVVQEAYYRVVAAVRQWAFPFAEKFLSAIPDLEASDYATMSRNLPLILNRLENYKTNVTTMDQAIMASSFISSPPTIPFFTWSYEHYPEKIEALLKGEKVILTTAIEKTRLDAVKFNRTAEISGACPRAG